MALIDWWTRLRARPARRPKQAPCVLRLEPLEDRTLLATINWTNPGSGLFNVGSNWSGGQVPGASDVAVINTAAAATITIQAGDSIQVQGITTASTDTLSFTGGALAVTSGASTLSGPLAMTRGALTARGSGVSLTANGGTTIVTASLSATGGASASLPNLTSYAILANVSQKLEAVGSGSTLTLGGLTTIVNFANLSPAGTTLEISAQQGGQVQLPALTAINPNNNGGNGAVTLAANGAASIINVSALTSYLGGFGSTLSVTNSGTVLDGNLTSPERVDLVLDATGTLAISQWTGYKDAVATISGGVRTFTNLANITNSSFVVSGGAQVSLPAVTTYTILGQGSYKLQASGAGSTLTLGGLSSIANFANVSPLGITLEIVAQQGGQVQLPALTTINPNNNGGNGAVTLEANGAGSIINVSALTTYVGGFGSTLSVTTSGTVLAAALTQPNGVDLDLDGSGTLAISQWTAYTNALAIITGGTATFTNLANITNSSFQVSGGAQVSLPAVTTYAILGRGTYNLKASGSGSKLTLGALSSIANFANVSPFTITLEIIAQQGGQVQLPALTIINPNNNGGNGAVTLDANGAGSVINVSALTSYLGGFGSTLSVKNSGSVLDGNLTSLDRVDVGLDGTGTIATSQWTSLIDGILTISGGTYSFPSLTLTGSSVSLQNNATMTLGGGSSNGNFSIGAAATLDFEGNYTLTGTSTVTGAGKVIFGSGTHIVSGSYSIGGSTQLAGGTTTFSKPAITGATTLASASTLGIVLDGASAGSFGQLSATGVTNLNGANLLLTHNAGTPVGSSYAIVNTTGVIVGTFNGLPEGAIVTTPDGLQFTISYQANGFKQVLLTLVGPTISSLSPTSGPVGTVVIIEGTNFTGATGVQFGGFGGAFTRSFTANSPTQIRVVVPSGAVTGTVVVSTPGGIAASSSNFTVTAFKTAFATGAAGQFPTGLAVGDFNGDGKLDTAVANYGPTGGNSVSVLFGTGSGTFLSPSLTIPLPPGTNPFGIATGKFIDGSNAVSIVTGNFSGQSVAFIQGNNDGTFETPEILPAMDSAGGRHKIVQVAVGDLNVDNRQDIVAASGDGTYTVFLGNGNGTFNALPSKSALTPIFGVAIANINTGSGPKRSLIVAAFAANKIGVLPGNGDGTFQAPIFTNENGITNEFLATGDFNTDGKADVATTNKDSGTISVLLGNGNGTFSSVTTYAAGTTPMGVSVSDVNEDGKRDISVANLGSNSVSVFIGDGPGTFPSAETFAAGASPLAIATGDFNPPEGMLDIVYADFFGNQQDKVIIAKNNTAAPPIIIGFSPGSGAVGSQVTIFGANFFNVIAVAFNGVATNNFVVNSPTAITVFVPTGATTGLIGVANNSGVGVSAVPFTVTA